MARFPREFQRSLRREARGQDAVRRDYGIDYGYRRGDFQGSARGRIDRFGGGSFAGRPTGSGRLGGGGPWDAYGSGDMGISLGRRGSGPRNPDMGGRSMRYDVGYGMYRRGR